MTTFFVLGSNGFLGSNLFRRLSEQNFRVVGLNRNAVVVSENGSQREYVRNSQLIFEDLKPMLAENDVVFNTVWNKNERQYRDRSIHLETANEEIELIYQLEKFRTKYVSFGSIAEIDDKDISPSSGTEYAAAKKLVARSLSESSLKHLWVRIASCYGPQDGRNWLITQLVESQKKGVKLEIQNPNQLLNLCHVNALIDSVISLIENERFGQFNAFTDQWVTIDSVRECCLNLVEPAYVTLLTGPFTISDPLRLYINTPKLSFFFADR